MISALRRLKRASLAAGSAITLTAGLLTGLSAPSEAATQGPCDIYAAGGTPCVAAHSTTRALYGSYNGPLYQVRRASDNTTRDIGVLSAGGVANAAMQDSFCANTTCLITIIYDQSGRNNRLTQAPPGGFNGPAPGGYDNLANATAAPITVGGQKAYGVYIPPGTGYRNNATNGVAKGDQPEGMYAIFDGTHYNGGCCLDYGNAETNSRDNGNGTMEAIYFGNNTVWGTGAGNGPWIMADLENGLFSGVNQKNNPGDPSISHRFLTAIIKGEPNHWAIRGGNAQSGSLGTFYDGARPSVPGYNPMKKEGAILLGIGGDNSNGARGTFYEGVMTSGYPSNATEDAVQANIVAARYSTSGSSSGIPTGWARVTNVATGLALDSGGNVASGSALKQWNWDGSTNLQWQLVDLGNGYYRLNNRTNGMVADSWGDATNGAYCKQAAWNGGNNQQWKLNNLGNGQYQIVNRGTGTALDSGGTTTAGSNVKLWAVVSSPNLAWTLTGV
ncbi:UNVERIFIED_ORG: hypothetical protein FHR35_007164 [Microbispora rosea subsp. rosea]